MLIQTNTSRAEIITFKNGFSINTDRPFNQQIEKTFNIIGPLKAKEFIAGLWEYLSKMRQPLIIV